MAKLSGRIIDKQSGEQVEARVQVLSSGGTFLHPPEVLMKVNFVMSKCENQSAPLSAPLLPTQGEMSIEKTAFGRYCRTVSTNWPMIVPACVAVIGCDCSLFVYWYQSGSISKMIGLVVP